MHDVEDSSISYKQYFAQLQTLLGEVNEADVALVGDLFWENYSRSARLVLCGNGGSAATASHLVADFQKNVYLIGGRPWECLALTDSTPLLTAWSNDTDYANVFAGQARCWLRPGDLLVAISGSGNSPNILHAVDAANEIGAQTVGLSGFGGGQLARKSQHNIIVHSNNMQLVEDVHMAIGHALFCSIRSRMHPDS
jgi:D-sedoheptulose 7-phosphate isomerase